MFLVRSLEKEKQIFFSVTKFVSKFYYEVGISRRIRKDGIRQKKERMSSTSSRNTMSQEAPDDIFDLICKTM